MESRETRGIITMQWMTDKEGTNTKNLRRGKCKKYRRHKRKDYHDAMGDKNLGDWREDYHDVIEDRETRNRHKEYQTGEIHGTLRHRKLRQTQGLSQCNEVQNNSSTRSRIGGRGVSKAMDVEICRVKQLATSTPRPDCTELPQLCDQL